MFPFIGVVFIISVTAASRGGDFTREELRDVMRRALILKDFLTIDRVYVYNSSGEFYRCIVYCIYVSGRSFIHCESNNKYGVFSSANGVFKNANEFRQFTNMSLPCDNFGLYV